MKPRISILIPVYDMPNKDFFLERCLNSIRSQTFQDYEIVMSENGGGWSSNHNNGIRQCSGELIKFLHMDDYFAHKDSLKEIVNNFTGNWLITACDNNQNPHWNKEIHLGRNTLGGPSCLTIKNKNPLFFDEELSWVVDLDYYLRLYEKYGEPVIIKDINVNIGIHEGQATNILSDEIKIKEYKILQKRYE